jgi:hypothetical protein
MAEPASRWYLGVDPAPLTADLALTIAPPLGAIVGDHIGVARFFAELGCREENPITNVMELRTRITWCELKALARRTLKSPTALTTMRRIIDPTETFEWPRPEKPPNEKRKRGGNGNNKPRMTLEEQLRAEDVLPLDEATFAFAPGVFDGIPRKGMAASIDAYVGRLFDQMWLAQLQIPQLRLYLRPAAIRRCVFYHLEKNYPPLSESRNKKGQLVTLDMKVRVVPPPPLSPFVVY